ncbi:MAG: hypothetical protein R6W94_08620 [Spirochaetia bacterium]
MSKNALIKQLLAENLGIPVDGAYTDDYREFLGLWTAEERAAFEKSQGENAYTALVAGAREIDAVDRLSSSL